MLEVADTGRFEWKLFISWKVCFPEETLEELRQQYIAFLCTHNLENKTIALYDYSFQNMVEGLGIRTVSDLGTLKPEQVQSMLTFLSGKLSVNNNGTIFPILRQVLSYVYASGLTPAYQNTHLSPYLDSADEKKLFQAMDKVPLRNTAMMRLALRLRLRDCDICNLRFSQIYWKKDRITLEQEKTGVPLSLPLLEDVGNAIMDYTLKERPKATDKCPYVFVRRQVPFKKL